MARGKNATSVPTSAPWSVSDMTLARTEREKRRSYDCAKGSGEFARHAETGNLQWTSSSKPERHRDLLSEAYPGALEVPTALPVVVCL